MKRIVLPVVGDGIGAESCVMPAGSPGMSSFQTSRRPVATSSRKTRAGNASRLVAKEQSAGRRR